MNNWSKLPPKAAVQKLLKLHAEYGTDKKTDQYIEREFDLFVEITSDRLKVMLNANWKDTPKSKQYLESVIAIKLVLDTFGDLIPQRMHILIEQNISNVGNKLVQASSDETKSNSLPINVRKSDLNLTSQVSQLSTCNRNISATNITDKELQFMESKLNTDLALNPLLADSVQNISQKLTAKRFCLAKSADLYNSESTIKKPIFDTNECGFCLTAAQFQARYFAKQPEVQKRKSTNPYVKKALRFYQFIKTITVHQSFVHYEISNSLELSHYNNGQVTFGNSDPIESAKYALRYLKKNKLVTTDALLVWGNEAYLNKLRELLSKAAIPFITLDEDMLRLVKAKSEHYLNVNEVALNKAKSSARKPLPSSAKSIVNLVATSETERIKLAN
ncbi:hypothetical protein [Vibrio splendidus]|uniref:hypothetical protein n=1 Tax=Vibrio splendidus TaxID=29497 RepID=UPI00352DA5BF